MPTTNIPIPHKRIHPNLAAHTWISRYTDEQIREHCETVARLVKEEHYSPSKACEQVAHHLEDTSPRTVMRWVAKQYGDISSLSGKSPSRQVRQRRAERAMHTDAEHFIRKITTNAAKRGGGLFTGLVPPPDAESADEPESASDPRFRTYDHAGRERFLDRFIGTCENMLHIAASDPGMMKDLAIAVGILYDKRRQEEGRTGAGTVPVNRAALLDAGRKAAAAQANSPTGTRPPHEAVARG